MSAADSHFILHFRSVPVRTLSLENRIWLSVADACKALGIGWNGTIPKALPPSATRLLSTASSSGRRSVRFATREALAALAVRRKAPHADDFSNWINRQATQGLSSPYQFRGAAKAGGREAEGEAGRFEDLLRNKVNELHGRVKLLKETASEIYLLAGERMGAANKYPRVYGSPRHALVCRAHDAMNILHGSLDSVADAILRNAQIIDLASGLYQGARPERSQGESFRK